ALVVLRKQISKPATDGNGIVSSKNYKKNHISAFPATNLLCQLSKCKELYFSQKEPTKTNLEKISPLSRLQNTVFWLLLLAFSMLGTRMHFWQLESQQQQARYQNIQQEAEQLTERITHLEAEVNQLRERSGLHNRPPVATNFQIAENSGGSAKSIPTEQLLKTVRRRLSLLTTKFQDSVKPALTAKLASEAIQPWGLPIDTAAEITSHFGIRRNPFGYDRYEFHDGIDFAGDYGTPVRATAPGIIVAAGRNGGYGNEVQIQHESGYVTYYSHLSKILVGQGTRVRRGDSIGYVGSTGRSTGPHLHYAIYHQGEAVNPIYYLGWSQTTLAQGKNNTSTPSTVASSGY
ncbi:M23 family metallopeptidase, partial [Geitlerinema sp. PCC 9228]|uniref:M23 family metallopeptidase n=1 Tax=Geitlerinema sp. PCC 9228 TaxID=111611 RepID=UPI001B8CC340